MTGSGGVGDAADGPAPDGTARALLALSEAVAGEVGPAFLNRLVAALRDAMEARLVFITATEGRPVERVRSVHAIEDGAPIDQFRYDFADTPCRQVIDGAAMVIPCNLARAFPKEAGLDGYVGVPLRAADGTVDGHLAIFSSGPVRDPDLSLGIARLFGQRIEAERRRLAAEEARETLIGELEAANGRLRRRFRDLHEANAFKMRLMGMIAHDLRSPLSAILSQAELLQARLSGQAEQARSAATAGKITGAADRMAAMIAATLDRARADAVGLTPARSTVLLPAQAELAAEVNRSAAEAKGIALQVQAEAGVAFFGDEDLLLDAIDNLVSNAVKYSRPGDRVSLGVRLVGEVAEIAVADTGQGLTEDDLARAFRRFATLSSKPTGGEAATGLGLASVREIVEAHGGAVSAESDGQNRGATFRIRLAPAWIARSGGIGAGLPGQSVSEASN